MALWIKLSVDGRTQWVNTAQVRRIESGAGCCRIVYTSRDIVRVDQSITEVMAALGYKEPPPPPIESHAVSMEEEAPKFETSVLP